MYSIPSHIKGLIFDLDGTLADNMPIHLAAWKLAGSNFGVDITDEMITSRSGMATFKIVSLLNEAYGWDLDPALTKQTKDMAYKELKPQIGLKPIEKIVAIAEAHRGKLPMSVGTGSTRPNAEETLIALGIFDWFDAVVTATDVKNYKPSPETFLLCAEKMGVAPETCLVFEDSPFGIQAAKTGGMEVIDVRDVEG